MARKPTPPRTVNEAFIPDERKAKLRTRLKKAKGQAEGIERMLAQDCPAWRY